MKCFLVNISSECCINIRKINFISCNIGNTISNLVLRLILCSKSFFMQKIVYYLIQI